MKIRLLKRRTKTAEMRSANTQWARRQARRGRAYRKNLRFS